MINKLTQFFTKNFLSEEAGEEKEQRGIEFATAALLIEVSRSDEERCLLYTSPSPRDS